MMKGLKQSIQIALGIALFVLIGMASEEESFFGMILIKEGDVLLTRGIMEFPAKIEDSLQYGDEVETGENGRVQLSFKSSFISIGPNSYFSIEKEEEEGLDITVLALEEGDIRSKIIDLDPDERYHIETEKGTVVVTGTDFVTSVGEDASASVSVLEGSIKMVGDGSETQSVGTMETLESQDGPGQLSPLGESQASQLKAALPVPTDRTESMTLLPDQGGQDVSIDLVAVDAIAQGVDPVVGAPVAADSAQESINSESSESVLVNLDEDGQENDSSDVDIDDPDVLPPDVVIAFPELNPPGGDDFIGIPGFDPPNIDDIIGMPGISPPGSTDIIGVPGIAPPGTNELISTPSLDPPVSGATIGQPNILPPSKP